MYIDNFDMERLIESHSDIAEYFIHKLNEYMPNMPLKDAGFIVDFDESDTQLHLMIFKGTQNDVYALYEDGGEYPEDDLVASLKMTPRFLEHEEYRSERVGYTDGEHFANPYQEDEERKDRAFQYDAGDKNISIQFEIDEYSFDGSPSYHRILKGIGKAIENRDIPLVSFQ